MRRISLVLGLGMLVLFTGPAAAVTVTEVESRELVIQSTDCTDLSLSECTWVQLVVVDRDGGTSEACLSIVTGQPIDETSFLALREESGCAPLDPSGLVFARNLESATLAATSIDLTLCDFQVEPNECAPSRTVTVSAIATATSRPERDIATSRGAVDGCNFVARESFQRRTGTGEVMVDGTSYTGSALIYTATETVTATC